MLKRLHPWRAWIVGALALLALVWIVETSQTFKGCINQSKTEAGEQTLYQRASSFFVILSRRQDCLGVFVHKNEGAITALATLLIAIFTLTLWRATDKMWKASQDQIELSRDVFVATERPWVGPRTVGAEQIAPNHPITAWVVIENTGRSPAREMRVHFQGDILAAGIMPPKPDVSQRPPKALFSGIPDWYHPFHQHHLSQANFDGIVAGKRVAWIIGRVEYRDTRNDPHFTDVCTRWDQPLGRFVPHDTGNDAN